MHKRHFLLANHLPFQPFDRISAVLKDLPCGTRPLRISVEHKRGDTFMQIPFFRPNIEQPEIDEVVATLRSGWLTTGPKTKQFEAEFAAYVRQGHAVAVNS